MATKKRDYGVPSAPDHYQADCDRDALLRAAEIVGDRLRLRNAMARLKKQQSGASKMIHVLSKR